MSTNPDGLGTDPDLGVDPDADAAAAALEVELGALAMGAELPRLRQARARVLRANVARDKAVLASSDAALTVEDRAGALEVARVRLAECEGDQGSTDVQRAAAREAVDKARRASERAEARAEHAARTADRAHQLVLEADRVLAEELATADAALHQAQPDTVQDADPEPLFETLPQFVEQIVAVVYAADFSVGAPRRWCAQWWRHPSVVFRLEGLWRAFEHLRLDATTGMSVFLRDHADPHMAVITSADGPLARCKPEQHQEPFDELGLVPPDAGLYTPENA